MYFICYRPWKFTIVPESSNVRTLIVMLKWFFFTPCTTNRICHLHNTLKNIPGKWLNYKKSFLRNFNKTDASYHQSIYSRCVLEHWYKHNGSVFSINSKVLLTQPFHCIPYQHETSETGFQVLWIISIWSEDTHYYRLYVYVYIRFVAILSGEQWELWRKDRESCTFYWSPGCCTYGVLHESRNNPYR